MNNIDVLPNCIDKLDPGDQDFARNLLTQHQASLEGKRKPLSQKQLYWVDQLVHRAAQGQAARIQVPNLLPIVNIFRQAKAHLKAPSIVFNDIMLGMAGDRSKVPGSINVSNYGLREWYGRILADGTFVPGHRYPITQEVADLLVAFAEDPAGTAGKYGRLSGRCCFCSLTLTDERSTRVGYGKVCASHFGLPWGK